MKLASVSKAVYVVLCNSYFTTMVFLHVASITKAETEAVIKALQQTPSISLHKEEDSRFEAISPSRLLKEIGISYLKNSNGVKYDKNDDDDVEANSGSNNSGFAHLDTANFKTPEGRKLQFDPDFLQPNDIEIKNSESPLNSDFNDMNDNNDQGHGSAFFYMFPKNSAKSHQKPSEEVEPSSLTLVFEEIDEEAAERPNSNLNFFSTNNTFSPEKVNHKSSENQTQELESSKNYLNSSSTTVSPLQLEFNASPLLTYNFNLKLHNDSSAKQHLPKEENNPSSLWTFLNPKINYTTTSSPIINYHPSLSYVHYRQPSWPVHHELVQNGGKNDEQEIMANFGEIVNSNHHRAPRTSLATVVGFILVSFLTLAAAFLANINNHSHRFDEIKRRNDDVISQHHFKMPPFGFLNQFDQGLLSFNNHHPAFLESLVPRRFLSRRRV